MFSVFLLFCSKIPIGGKRFLVYLMRDSFRRLQAIIYCNALANISGFKNISIHILDIIIIIIIIIIITK